MKKITIFINSHNDTDNILPFIDYLLLNGKSEVVLCYTRLSDLNTCKDHVSYLKDTYNLIPIEYDRDFSERYRVFMKFYLRVVKFSGRAKENSFFIPFKIFLSRLKLLALYLTEREVNKNSENLDVDVIMIDQGKELGFYGSAIVKYAKNKNTAVVGYAHGSSIYTNIDPLQKDKIKLTPIKEILLRLSKPRIKRRYCDRYVGGMGQKKSYFSTSMMPNYEEKYLDRVYEIGSIRYTYEWISKYRRSVVKRNSFAYGSKEKMNVVLFITHPKYNVYVDDLIATMNALSLCDSINFVYKPHTRNGLNRIDVKKNNGGYDAANISSIELSSWADVGIVYGSSISFQLVMDNVPIIMPKYLHGNTTIFEDNNACILVNNLSSLMSLMQCSIKELSNMTKQEKNKEFIEYHVYGNKSYVGLMDDFYDSVFNDTTIIRV
jgi:hypothetical protein